MESPAMKGHYTEDGVAAKSIGNRIRRGVALVGPDSKEH